MTNNAEIEKLYGHYLDGFIREVNPHTSRAEILSQMTIHPIIFETNTAGILGMTIHKKSTGALAVIRLIYLEKQYRGHRMGEILEQLFDTLAQQGFTHVESWTLPHISDWLHSNWKIQPKVFVYHEDLAKLRQKIKDLKNEPNPLIPTPPKAPQS